MGVMPVVLRNESLVQPNALVGGDSTGFHGGRCVTVDPLGQVPESEFDSGA